MTLYFGGTFKTETFNNMSLFEYVGDDSLLFDRVKVNELNFSELDEYC